MLMNADKKLNAQMQGNNMPINLWLQIIYLNRGSRIVMKSKTNVKTFRDRFHIIQTRLKQYRIIDNLRHNKICNKSHFGASWTFTIRICKKICKKSKNSTRIMLVHSVVYTKAHSICSIIWTQGCWCGLYAIMNSLNK